jgi:hypothetical protein
MGKSITTEQWKSHLYGYFEGIGGDKIKALDSINWNVSRLVVLVFLISQSDCCACHR